MASRGDPRRAGTDSPEESAAELASAGAAAQLPPGVSGLHVLVVDDDPLCLMIVGKMLRSCGYSVTTADGGLSALRLLNETPDRFALVLSDVHMPDMDGFRLMERIALELDVPVIMMSANGETDVVLRGITHGAVDYLLKPVRIEELRNLWQHVVRRRREDSPGGPLGSKDEVSEERMAAAARAEKGGGRKEKHKRKEGEAQGELGEEPDDGSQSKKPRVVWSVELHQQFVKAVNSLGIDKAVPKRILDLMGVAGLTRENVASHLQKYRLYLKRIQSVNGGGGGGGGAGPFFAAPAAPARAAPHALPSQPLAPAPALASLLAPLPPPAFDVHLPGTAPGGGYPAHLLPLGGLNGGLPLGLSLCSDRLSLVADIQAVSDLDMGIHGLSMDALGGDELLTLSNVGELVASPSAVDMMSLFLKDALPEALEALP